MADGPTQADIDVRHYLHARMHSGTVGRADLGPFPCPDAESHDWNTVGHARHTRIERRGLPDVLLCSIDVSCNRCTAQATAHWELPT